MVLVVVVILNEMKMCELSYYIETRGYIGYDMCARVCVCGIERERERE